MTTPRTRSQKTCATSAVSFSCKTSSTRESSDCRPVVRRSRATTHSSFPTRATLQTCKGRTKTFHKPDNVHVRVYFYIFNLRFARYITLYAFPIIMVFIWLFVLASATGKIVADKQLSLEDVGESLRLNFCVTYMYLYTYVRSYV